MLTIPPYPKWLSALTLIYGVFTFMWMGAEDSVWLVTVLGLGLALLCVAHGVFRLKGRTFAPRLWVPAAIILGAATGAGTALITMLFMVMKVSLHNHLYPDYPFPLISGIAGRLLPWTAAGALVGLALALILYRAPDSNGSSGASS
jgi:hypothetical protein